MVTVIYQVSSGKKAFDEDFDHCKNTAILQNSFFQNIC